ncbi:MAG: hypothetical protein HZB76_03230 [Chlamydiae bacterium]|nr:hypothetical protein [Chlamydiota bacterium]
MAASLDHTAHLGNSSPTPADIQAEEKFTKQAIIITAIAVTALLTCLIIMQWGAIAALAISVAHIIIPSIAHAIGTVVTFYLNNYVWITAIGIITTLSVANHYRLKKREQELLAVPKPDSAQIATRQPSKQTSEPSTSTTITLAGAHPAALPGSATGQQPQYPLPPMPTTEELSPEQIQRLIEQTMPEIPHNLPAALVVPPPPPPPPPSTTPKALQNRTPHAHPPAPAPIVRPQDAINRAIVDRDRRLRPVAARTLSPAPTVEQAPREAMLAAIRKTSTKNLTPALARTLSPAPEQAENTIQNVLNKAITGRRR